MVALSNGFPLSVLSMRASSFEFASIKAANLSISRLLTLPGVAAHPFNALVAAVTAKSISSF